LTQRTPPAVFELLYHAPQRMVAHLLSGITRPRASASKMRRARQTTSASMIIPTCIHERSPTDGAQRMRDDTDLRPASGAEILRIAATDPSTASATTGRVKPVHKPVEAISKRSAQSGSHKARRTLAKFRAKTKNRRVKSASHVLPARTSSRG